MDISPETQNTQDTICKTHETQEEDQSVDTLILFIRGNKIPMEGVTETKFGAELKGRIIQRLPHPGIHPIYNHQTQTPFQKDFTDRTLI